MAAAVFHAKFAVPSLPACYQARPRLDALWRQWRDARLITVTAGAGWGKTCFLASHVRRFGDNALWYTLDDLDRDPSVLAAHLVTACGMEVSDAPPLEQLARIVGALEGRRLLVLDDVQAIEGAAVARSFLGRLLRYLTPSCQLILAARVPVSLRDARLETRGEAVRLDGADLAFTVEESAAVLRHRLGRRYADPIIPRVHELTEGWPAGLEVICQSLTEAEPATHTDVLGRFEVGGGRWFDVFVDEVLTELDGDTREFLLKTSVLPHLEAELCNRMLRRKDSATVLERLATGGLFTVRVGEGAWRYHNLLRGCLRRRLDGELTPTVRRRSLRRAAALLADAGEPEAAVLDLVRNEDLAGAADQMARHAAELVATRRPETLKLALELLPEDQILGRPEILLIRAGLAQLQGHWGRAESDLRRALRGPCTGRITSALRGRLVRLHLQRGHWETCLRSGQRALDGRPGLVAADRGEVLAAMGVAAASLGRMATGEVHLRQALSLARRRGDRALQGRCLFLLAANVSFVRGDLASALEAATEARDLYGELDRGDLVCHAEGVLGFVLAGLGRENEARHASLWALQHAEAIGYRLIAGYARLTLGECDLLVGDLAAARDQFAEARRIARDLGEEALLNWTCLGLAEEAWRRDDRLQAEAASDEAYSLAERRGDRFCLARALAHRGRLQFGRDRPAALASWRRADQTLARLGSTLEQARLRLWRARAESPDALAVAVAEIAAGPHVHLLARWDKDDLETAEFDRVGAPGMVRFGDENLHIRALGPLEIDLGGGPLVRGAWRSRRARRLLNVLLGARLDPVPRERVQELLWPDGDPRKTAGNLRQAVFQLRRVLQPEGVGDPGFVRTDGETLRLDLGSGGTCDLIAFESALAQARRARRERRDDDELGSLLAAIDLWRGAYLADTPYEPEVEDLGSSLRQGFLRAAERAVDLLMTQHRWDDLVNMTRLALAEDPLHEPFARGLLEGLLQLGHRREVQVAYARFEARVVQELDMLPSSRLKALAEAAGGPLTPG